MRYLHAKKESDRQLYESNLARYLENTRVVAASLAKDGETGLVVSPPSDDLLADPYRHAITETLPDYIDISGSVERVDSNIKSRNNATFEQLFSNLRLSGELTVSRAGGSPMRLLIVDESFSTGRTASILECFLSESLSLSFSEVSVFAALRISPTPPEPNAAHESPDHILEKCSAPEGE